MKKFFILMISFLLLLVIAGGNKVSAKETSLNGQCTQILNYLTKNIDEFQYQYNLTLNQQEEQLDINGFEGYSLIYILDNDSYGIYIDFNDNQGYILLSFDFIIYELCTSGDLDYLKNVSFAYYYSADGFLYKTEQSYERYNRQSSLSTQLYSSSSNGVADGMITNIDSYVASNYSNYTYVQTVDKVQNYYPTPQFKTSYYVNVVSGKVYPEGNCALNAMYNVLNSWQKNGVVPNIPSDRETVDWLSTIEQDKLYTEFGMGQPGNGDYWTVNRDYAYNPMPALYDRIRTYAIVNYKYNPNNTGLSMDQCTETINYVPHHFYYTDFEPLTSSAFYDVTSRLSDGKAIFLYCNNSQTYGNHAMCVIGYREYSYKTGWWVFQQTKSAYFYLVDDGHSNSAVYFDPNRSAVCEFIYC